MVGKMTDGDMTTGKDIHKPVLIVIAGPNVRYLSFG